MNQLLDKIEQYFVQFCLLNLFCIKFTRLIKKSRAHFQFPTTLTRVCHFFSYCFKQFSFPVLEYPTSSIDHYFDHTYTMSQRFADLISKIALPAGLTIALAQASMYDVPGGKRAVIFDRLKGVEQKVIGEGTHFLIPWLQKAVIFDVRVEPRVITTTTGSKDLQNVSLTLRVLSRPEVRKLPFIYQNLGLDYAERVLPAIGNEILKSIVAQFDAAELITQREVVSARIRQELSRRADEFNIELEDVSITHMTFGKEFTKAVEQKQIAQQDAERSKYLVEKAEQEKKAAIIRAEGEAEAADLVSKALAKAGDGLLMIRRLEASKDIATTLANSPNITYLPNGDSGKGGDGSNNSLLLNIGR